MLTFNTLRSELKLPEEEARVILICEKDYISTKGKMDHMSKTLKGFSSGIALGDDELTFALLGSLKHVTICHYKGVFSINAPQTIIDTFNHKRIRDMIDTYNLHSDKYQGEFISNVNVTIDLVKKELLLHFNETVINDLGFVIWEYVRSVY